jgi:hypothetical protein
VSLGDVLEDIPVPGFESRVAMLSLLLPGDMVVPVSELV